MPDFNAIDSTVVTLVLGDQIVPLPHLAVAPGGHLPGLTDLLVGMMHENKVLVDRFTCTSRVMNYLALCLLDLCLLALCLLLLMVHTNGSVAGAPNATLVLVCYNTRVFLGHAHKQADTKTSFNFHDTFFLYNRATRETDDQD